MCIGPKIGSCYCRVSGVKAPTVPNHCLLHIPPTEPCPGLDWQLPNICLTQIALLLNLASSNAEGFVDLKQATPVGGREVNVWRPNAARRSNLGFSSPGEWWKPHFNKLGFPVINPGMKGSDQGGAWDRQQQTSSTLKLKADQWQILNNSMFKYNELARKELWL